MPTLLRLPVLLPLSAYIMGYIFAVTPILSLSLQRFRAGIEGSISVLKRTFGLLRCLFKGFEHFAASVGLSIFCHNLVVLAMCPRE